MNGYGRLRGVLIIEAWHLTIIQTEYDAVILLCTLYNKPGR